MMPPPDLQLYLGIMTGTSLDAIDLAVCRFEGIRVELLRFQSTPWTAAVREKLFNLATSDFVRMDDVARLHFVLAREYARAVNETLQAGKIDAGDIRAIGLHGQTVRHLPLEGATLQLGSGTALAVLTGIDVVSDFRGADVALGGQGAPLMPMFDYAFLKSETSDRATLNVGGIANITWLPKSAREDEVVAFDTGPGNMLLDLVCQKYFHEPFDQDGLRARSGSISGVFLSEMLGHSYFALAPPKTTGRELFGAPFIAPMLEAVDRGELRAEDALATLTELTARSIAESFRFTSSRGPVNEPSSTVGDRSSTFELIMSGGGTRNTFLVERIKTNAPNANVISSDVFGIPVSAKEAIAFAFFAKAFLEEIPIHLPRTTGARTRATLGSLAKAARLS